VSTVPRRRRAVQITRIVVDFGLPLAAYYGLRLAGVGVYVALLVSALLSAASGLVSLIRDRRFDGISGYMTVMMLGSVVVSFVSGGARFLLARGALLTGVTGVWFIASLWARRPLAYLFSRPLLEGRLHWPSEWESLWDRSPRFRRMWRVSSVLHGIGALLDASARVVMAYTLPPDVVPALSTALYAVTTVVLITVNTVYYVVCGVYDRRSAIYRLEPRPGDGSDRVCVGQPLADRRPEESARRPMT
jgi:hypothetical protein